MPPEQQEKKTQIHENEDEHNQVARTSRIPSPQQNKHKQVLGIQKTWIKKIQMHLENENTWKCLGIKPIHLCNSVVILVLRLSITCQQQIETLHNQTLWLPKFQAPIDYFPSFQS